MEKDRFCFSLGKSSHFTFYCHVWSPGIFRVDRSPETWTWWRHYHQTNPVAPHTFRHLVWDYYNVLNPCIYIYKPNNKAYQFWVHEIGYDPSNGTISISSEWASSGEWGGLLALLALPGNHLSRSMGLSRVFFSPRPSDSGLLFLVSNRRCTR